MFGWFRTKSDCPVDSATREWIDRRWEWLEAEFGRDRLRKTKIVLPRPEFFPDPYSGTTDDIEHMFRRVCRYMYLDPDTVELSFYQERNPVHQDGRQQGTAGLYRADGDKFRIAIEISKRDDPLAMVATMAHELGHVHLLGHERISNEEDDHEPLTDLLTVYFGLGVCTANSVIREHHWQAGHFSGWRIGRQGYLGMTEYGYALARFALARDEDGSLWAHELRLDVRSAFKQSMRFLSAGRTYPEP